MLYIVIILVVMLIVATIVINGLQQKKQKEETDRKREIAKQKAILDDSDELLSAAPNLPVTANIILALQNRMMGSLQNLKRLMPDSIDVKQRIDKLAQDMEGGQREMPQEEFALPDNDQQLIAILQGVKKLRAVLRSEHNKGALPLEVFSKEEKRLEFIQLKINIESLLKRAKTAHSNNMVGSARQYFEKIIVTIQGQQQSNEYTQRVLAEANEYLNQIKDELQANESGSRKAADKKKEEDDLDVLFQPKKKW